MRKIANGAKVVVLLKHPADDYSVAPVGTVGEVYDYEEADGPNIPEGYWVRFNDTTGMFFHEIEIQEVQSR